MSKVKAGLLGAVIMCAMASSSYADDGFTTYTPSGNTVYGSDGSTTISVGNSLIHQDSDGNSTTYNKTSTGLIGSDLSTTTNVGNTSSVVRDSQGNISTCVKSGNSVICN